MTGASWVAVLSGWLFTYWNSKLTEERKARIERVNEQLRDFYGPLLACVSATSSAYRAMVHQHSDDGTGASFQRAVAANPDGKEAGAYRLWVKEVLQPLNERAADIIFDHLDLLESSRVVPELLQLVAHVSTMRVMLQRWKEGDLDTKSAISYPDKLLEFVQREFGQVKNRQAELLGMTNPVRSKL